MHFFSLFTCAGRLSRRDYALTVGALLGFPPFLTLLAQLFFTPLVYLFSTIFFRESTIAFWVLLICCALLFITVLYTVLPLITIPATVRRLHDMRHSGVFAAPLVLLALLPLTCFSSLLLLFLAAIEHLTGAALLPSFLQIPPPQDYDTLGILLVAVLPVLLALGLFLVCYTAWIFFEKGLPTENAYGAPPVQEPLPSVYTMFFTTQGAITRDDCRPGWTFTPSSSSHRSIRSQQCRSLCVVSKRSVRVPLRLSLPLPCSCPSPSSSSRLQNSLVCWTAPMMAPPLMNSCPCWRLPPMT